jgi:hypothetical protein
MHGWPLAVGPKAGMGWLSNPPFPRDIDFTMLESKKTNFWFVLF